jgi:CRP-like cAMP-binding protein
MKNMFMAIESYMKNHNYDQEYIVEQCELLLNICNKETYGKGRVVSFPGSSNDEFFFIEEGVMRSYLVDDKDREYTRIFECTGGVIGPYTEYMRGVSCKYHIETVTKATVYRFSISTMYQLAEESDFWEYLLSYYINRSLKTKNQRETELLVCDAFQRYQSFKERFKEYHHLIPQYKMASYIGVTPEGLNRSIKKAAC